MYCSPDFEVSSFGSLFFLGVALSTLTMKFGDNIGRNLYFVIGASMTTTACWGLIFWTNQYARYVFMFLDGLGGF